MNKEDNTDLNPDKKASYSMDQVSQAIPKVPVKASDDRSLIVGDHEAYPTVQMPLQRLYIWWSMVDANMRDWRMDHAFLWIWN